MSRIGPMKTSSRYQSPAVRPGFRMELTALARARDVVGRDIGSYGRGECAVSMRRARGRKEKESPRLIRRGDSHSISCYQSGRVDLNHRPPGPEPGALTGLRHAPKFRQDARIAAEVHREFMVRLENPGVPRERAT